jgi:hypothetical protein
MCSGCALVWEISYKLKGHLEKGPCYIETAIYYIETANYYIETANYYIETAKPIIVICL